MSELEKLVRRRMKEEYAKGASAEEISQTLRQVFNSVDPSAERPVQTAPKTN
ncbi:hypothetical protein [Rhizobium sp. BE258]|jgi:hypothetical protein|uniref:hypothetical protein n=1 Tax=unclassified Rhizobium TaxID=2613769 RepID=UPI00285A7B8A|nr:hypothetical protein [Rhizobium sp. BE258]MDR7143461.1 hypothetical protein [Rhizobium sp. BE258]